MKYQNIKKGIFIDRPNRFIAHILIDGKEETVHVKNTGRCGELLIPGAEVVVEDCRDNPKRSTGYDLLTVRKGERLVNMDSQAPNKIAAEYIPHLYPDAVLVKPEQKIGNSRLDFYIENAGGRKIYMEVKGVTLELDDVVLFPDAPTERGIKHLQELMSCVRQGYEACVLFVVQMGKVKYFTSNDQTHPAFGQALREAALAGVDIRAVDCIVTEDTVIPNSEVEIRL